MICFENIFDYHNFVVVLEFNLQMRDATKYPILFKTECQVGKVDHARLKETEGKREKLEEEGK